jgi:hypothetical protein
MLRDHLDTTGLSRGALRRFEGLRHALRRWPAELGAIVDLSMWLHWRSTGEPGAHVFHGGHVRLEDDARLYRYVRAYLAGGRAWDWWWGGSRARGGSRRGAQTHRTLHEPVEVTLPARLLTGWGCLLVGTHERGTWFQAEGSSVRRGLAPLVHHAAVDYVKYRLTGLQVGPLGRSARTDRDPLVVPRDLCTEGMAARGIP